MADCGHLKVSAENGGGVCLLSVSGELDFASAEDFTVRARRLVDGRPKRLVLDLAGLVFADCAGVRALAGVTGMVPGTCPVIVRSACPLVRRILELMGLEDCPGQAGRAFPAWP